MSSTDQHKEDATLTGKYIDLADRIGEGAEYSNTTSFCLGIECALRWLDEHPEQVPRPRMTYSELAEEVKSVERVEKRFEAVAYVLTNLGFTICSDPEPSNADKLEKLLDEARVSFSLTSGGLVRGWAEWLDEHGVKAPGGADE